MKILTGRLRGRALPFAPAQGLRPTADKVRKAVFDVLQGFAEGKRVLDLYSGTGAMGFEALSQEAAFVHFVERDAALARKIETMLHSWNLESRARVDVSDALHIIRREEGSRPAYDLVFMDPPYGEDLASATLEALARAGIVRKGGLIVVECGKREVLPESLSSFETIRDRRYGQSRLVIYRA